MLFLNCETVTRLFLPRSRNCSPLSLVCSSVDARLAAPTLRGASSLTPLMGFLSLGAGGEPEPPFLPPFLDFFLAGASSESDSEGEGARLVLDFCVGARGRGERVEVGKSEIASAQLGTDGQHVCGQQ